MNKYLIFHIIFLFIIIILGTNLFIRPTKNFFINTNKPIHYNLADNNTVTLEKEFELPSYSNYTYRKDLFDTPDFVFQSFPSTPQEEFMVIPEISSDQSMEKNTTPPLQLEGLEITGVVKINDIYKVIIEDKKEQKGYYLKVGDYLYGAKVIEIDEDKVVFEKDGSKVKLNRASRN